MEKFWFFGIIRDSDFYNMNSIIYSRFGEETLTCLYDHYRIGDNVEGGFTWHHSYRNFYGKKLLMHKRIYPFMSNLDIENNEMIIIWKNAH